MEGGGSAGGGVYTTQEPRERRRQEEAGRQTAKAVEGAGGGMRLRVSGRAPHGLGALLLIGGAVLAGAAVVAWRHARRRRRDARRDVADGGVVKDGKKGGTSAMETGRPDDKVLGGVLLEEIDRPDDNLKGEEKETETESKGLGNGAVAEEIEEVQDDAEIVEEGSVCSSFQAVEFRNSGRDEKTDLGLGKSSAEISMHLDVDSEHVERYDENPSTKLSEITMHDMDTATVEKVDGNSKHTENDHSPTKDDTDQNPITNHTENENSSKNKLKKQDDEEVKAASNQHSESICRPGMVLDKQSLRSGGAQETAESMENSPTVKLIMHQEQLSDDMTMDTEGETAEANLEKGAVLDKDMPKQEEQQKAMAEPVGLGNSPALSSRVKPREKEPELSGRIERGMKMEQDYVNGGLKEHALIGKGGAIMTMDRWRSSSMAIVALMFLLSIGVAIVVRLYAPPRATKSVVHLQ